MISLYHNLVFSFIIVIIILKNGVTSVKTSLSSTKLQQIAEEFIFYKILLQGNFGDCDAATCDATTTVAATTEAATTEAATTEAATTEAATTEAATTEAATTAAPCLTTSGETCVFPFIYNGKIFTECTTEGGFAPWCATKTDANGYQVTVRNSSSKKYFFLIVSLL